VLSSSSPIVIVGIQELVSKDGQHELPLLNKIQEAKGIHNYFRLFYPDFDGIVILSPIMPDDAIKGMTTERYAEMINILIPNHYLTMDGLTYRGRILESRYAVEYLMLETPKLLALCPNSTPIGLVKGCNIELLSAHLNSMKKLGIQLFAFHTGDYFRGRKVNLSEAKMFVKHIRKHVPWLMAYGGIGSTVNMLRFWDADCFATSSHFIRAFRKQKREDGRWRKSDLSIPEEQLIWRNFYMLKKELASMQRHAKISEYITRAEKETRYKIRAI
jgi:hypothetical protein